MIIFFIQIIAFKALFDEFILTNPFKSRTIKEANYFIKLFIDITEIVGGKCGI
jgi:hypothetical protein